MNHPGRGRTLYQIRGKYYWPRLYASVTTWIARCDICRRRKTTDPARNGLNFPVSRPKWPFQVIQLDFIHGLPTLEDGSNTIGIGICPFTNYPFPFACRNEDAAQAVRNR